MQYGNALGVEHLFFALEHIGPATSPELGEFVTLQELVDQTLPFIGSLVAELVGSHLAPPGIAAGLRKNCHDIALERRFLAHDP